MAPSPADRTGGDGHPMRDSAGTTLIGILATVAIAVVAAGIHSTPLIGDTGSPSQGSNGGGGAAGAVGGVASGPGDAFTLPYLPEFVSVLVVVAVLLILAIAVIYWREALILALSLILFLGVVLFLHGLFVGPEGSFLPPVLEPMPDPGTGGEGGETTSASPALVLTLVLGGAVSISIALLAVYRRVRTNITSKPDDAGVETQQTESLGRAAGRAADRLDSTADIDNEIYRAWREMTASLDVPRPETSTPGEFAEAAIDAGIDSGDVTALTRLFEDVRYGTSTATPANETRAREIFRRIETRYTTEDA